MKISKIRQIIKEELEVILTNQEVGDLFGEDVQAKLKEGGGFFDNSAQEEEAEAAEISAATSGEPYKDDASSLEEAEESSPPTDAEVIASIEEVLADPEGLSDETKNRLETILHHMIKGKMGREVAREGDESDEEEAQRRMSKAVKNYRRMSQRAKAQGTTNIDRTPFGRHLAKKAKED